MSSVGTKRKLTTIMAADVVGYSRLVATDDEATVRRLHAMHDVIAPLVGRHDGRLFGEAGDSLMAEFPSAVEAVRCALAIQEEIAERNEGMTPEHAMNFRIGIDIGEVIVEGENLYGDGVNIAARLQEIAEPGGVALSAAAHDQIKNRVSLDIEPLGPRNLKNIIEPVSVFRVRTTQTGQAAAVAPRAASRFGWRRRAIAAATAVFVVIGGIVAWDIWAGPSWQLTVFKAEAAQPLPSQPSIVVMPFLNASENESQEYFCLGVAEDIMTSLTKVSGLFVVGRESAMSLKGKNLLARNVGRELGVRYILQGSVRRAENRVRISTYLVDAATEQTVWAARYDRELGDIFAVQDNIAENVVQALSVSFRPGERESIRQQVAQAPKSPEVHDLLLQARQKMIPPTRENLDVAERLFRQVVQLDDSHPDGHAGLSLVHSLRVTQGFMREPQARTEELRKARDRADGAVTRGRESMMAMFAKASAALPSHDLATAEEFSRKSFQAQPGDAYTAATLGLVLTFAGKPREAYFPLEQAIARERVKDFRARAEFFKLFAAYEAADYKAANEAYSAHLAAGGKCFSNCLAYAAATKLQLADRAQNPEERDRMRGDAASIARRLKQQYPEYPFRLDNWLGQYANPQAAANFKKDVDRVYALAQ